VDNKADREQLIEFSRRIELLKEEYSDHRHLKLLRHLTRMAENVGGLADALEDREATVGPSRPMPIQTWILPGWRPSEASSFLHRSVLRPEFGLGPLGTPAAN
jgi:hypothetical protein